MKNTLLIILAVLIVGTASTVQATENNEAQKVSRKELKQQQISEALDIIKSGQFVIAIDIPHIAPRQVSYGIRKAGNADAIYASKYSKYGLRINRDVIYDGTSSNFTMQSYNRLLTINLSDSTHKCDTIYTDDKSGGQVFVYSKNNNADTPRNYYALEFATKGDVTVYYYNEERGCFYKSPEQASYKDVFPIDK